MRFIDFFAGIGGFRRGMEQAGHKCVGFCEFDKFAVASYTSMHLLTDRQREKLKEIPLKKRQKEILKDEYRNGEWYANDIRTVVAASLPAADCWCFGFPCQDISVAGKQAGFSGHRSSLFFAVTGLIRDTEEENRPKYLFIENVENLLSINGGGDFLKLLIELDEIGYNAEWQVVNSKDFRVQQNRKRVFIIGHFRGKRTGKILPVTGAGGENNISIIGHREGYRRNTQVFSQDGITEALSTCQGGGGEHHVAIPFCIDMNYGAGIKETENVRALQARYYKGISKRSGESSCVAIPVLTPDRVNKRQNGRRFKEDGEPMFTLTAQDRHGVAIGIIDTQGRKGKKAEPKEICPTLRSETHGNIPQVCIDITGESEGQEREQGIFVEMPEGFVVYAVWSEKYHCYLAIRKLTPRECFRLQGWEDEYFDRAEFVNSDSQLYKQAGNGVTVSVIRAIAEKMKEQEETS